MPRRMIVILITALATVAAISGCEVTQINWSNRTYTVSGNCLGLASVTLHDGRGFDSLVQAACGFGILRTEPS